MSDYAAIEKEARIFTEECVTNNRIDPTLFAQYDIKRGLRDKNGKGVLAGITNISRIDAFEERDGQKVPCEGKLWYRGYNVYDLIRGLRGKRYAFEGAAYLLLLGDLPNKEQLESFTACLAKCRDLPTNFVRDVIMKAPSHDLMNSLTRSVLTLASYDDDIGKTDLQTQLEQCIKLISVFPMLAVYGYHAYNYYECGGSMYIHRPDPSLSTAENLLKMLRPDQKYTDLEAHVLDIALLLAGLTGVHFLPEADAYRAADQVVTIGGDGTLLRAGLSCMKHGKPVLGVNLGRTGFLATCEVGELTAKLKRLAAGEFTLANRRLLHAEAPAHGWQADAINDLVVFGQTRLHPMDYKVYCDGALVGSYRSDGMILATPTGSTAYSFSAGGPILDAAADVLVLTPVCAHNVHAAPLVFAADRHLKIIADAENRDGSFVCADSSAQCDLLPGESLLVTGCGQRLRLIAFDDAEQFHAIENKLMRR